MKPIRSGGSPIGVKAATHVGYHKDEKDHNMTLLFLQEFILITGRTISMLAPVVPIQLESCPQAQAVLN